MFSIPEARQIRVRTMEGPMTPGRRLLGFSGSIAMLMVAVARTSKIGRFVWPAFAALDAYMCLVAFPGVAVDVIISSGVINLSFRKRRVVEEMFRVLRPGGRCSAKVRATNGGATRRRLRPAFRRRIRHVRWH